MTEPTETTLMGWKAWIVVGIICFSGMLVASGFLVPEARLYVEKAVSWGMNFIPLISKF